MVYDVKETSMGAYHSLLLPLKKLNNQVVLIFNIKSFFIGFGCFNHVKFTSNGNIAFVNASYDKGLFPLIIFDFVNEKYAFYYKPNFYSYLYNVEESSNNIYKLQFLDKNNIRGDNYSDTVLNLNQFNWFDKYDINSARNNLEYSLRSYE